MGNTKWILLLFLFLSISGLLCGLAEGSYVGPYAERGVWDAFIEARTVTFSIPLIGQFGFPLVDWGEVITSLWDMFMWNYAVLNVDRSFEATAQFFLQVLTAAFAFSLIWMFIALIRGGS